MYIYICLYLFIFNTQYIYIYIYFKHAYIHTKTCGCPATTLNPIGSTTSAKLPCRYPATFKKQPSHFALSSHQVSLSMWLSSHQMYLKFNREFNREINREIKRTLSVFEEKVFFKNESKIQSLHFQLKQILLKKSCFQ